MHRCLPVTLVGGFLGGGKTSLLHHFISVHRGGHLAVLVESPGAINHDAAALRGLCGAMGRVHDAVLEIPPGDDTAQTAWIAAQLREWSRAGRYERVLIEVAGTTNAARLGRHFDPRSGSAGLFAPWAELRQIVCVVDALDFVCGTGTSGPDFYGDFVRRQIEGANLVVLNKCDLIDDEQRIQATKRLCALNPAALVVETAYGEIPEEAWRQERSLPQAVPGRSGGDAPLAGEVSPASPALACALYRAYRPFHPARFWEWFNAEHPGLLRVKGLVWMATRSLLVGGVSRTLRQNSCGGAGLWWAALPREDWPTETEALGRMQETWREPYGDRRQELVLIGEAATLASATRGLDSCLLDAWEFARPLADWSVLPDPFPAWDLGDEA